MTRREVTLDEAFAIARECFGGGRLDEAAMICRQILAAEPARHDALHLLGLARLRTGLAAEAAADLARAAELAPALGYYRLNLGHALLALCRNAEAEAAYREALRIAGEFPEGLAALGAALFQQARHAEAETLLHRALELKPGDGGSWYNLGLVCNATGRPAAALRALTRAAELDPSPEGFNNLGNALKALGDVAGACSAYEAALRLQPGRPESVSNLLLALNYRDDLAPAAVARAHREGGATLMPAAAAPAAPSAAPATGRRLRIGYVSADFRLHSVAFFIEPLLRGHDRARFEVFLYADVPFPDTVSQRLRGLGTWRDIAGQGDEAVAATVRADGIDVLVDLSGHTAGNRLGVFARRAAPVQASYLGYPNTTGLPTMDWRITDGVADPAGAGDGLHTERLWRLPRSFLCYRPPTEAPGVAERAPPNVTFGSFNAIQKASPAAIACWARILAAAPGSCLMLKDAGFVEAGTGCLRERMLARFAAHGIGADRLVFAGREPDLVAHLGRYGEVDVALDTFPYNGTTTTCEALWMGAPVVTLAGNRHAARVGASILAAAGLDELVATTPERYVELTVGLARDAGRRAALRSGMRERLRASALTDEKALAGVIEAAYGGMLAADQARAAQ